MARKRKKAVTKKAARERLERIGALVNLAARPSTPEEGKAAEAALERLGATPIDLREGPVAKRQADERKAAEAAQERLATKAAAIATKATKAAKPAREPLTDKLVKDELPPPTGNRIRYDGVVPGFGICITAAGARSFVLNYRLSYRLHESNKARRCTIGRWPSWTVAAARREAKRLRQLIDTGGDPLADVEAKRDAKTMPELIARFEKEHLPRRRIGTATDYRSMIRVHIQPALGKLKVVDVKVDHIEKLHAKITAAGHEVRANSVVRVLSKMFTLAVKWEMCKTNPCKGVEKNKEFSRRRYLNGDELPRLVEALASHPKKDSADAFRLLLFTGARRGEVLAMRWADVDLTNGLWSKPPSSTKQREQHEVPLSAPALQLLKEIRDAQIRKTRVLPEFVFPGHGASKHVVDIKRTWQQVCAAAGIATAGIKGLKIHDLRHSFASQLVSSGASLEMIGALLGHSRPSTTQRYSHMFQDPQRLAVEQVGAIIVKAGRPGKAAARRV
jgi:integrase